VKEPDSFGDPAFLKGLESIIQQVSPTPTGRGQSESQAKSDTTELVDALVAQGTGKEFPLNQELERACLATGATGAAIALVRGQEMVCLASTGPQAPDIGLSLDARNGLSGSCLQTRRLQQCNDTHTDPRVDPEACRHFGIRSIVVLPLMDGDELFGIVEILSSRTNAFGQHDLETLQALADRIVERRRQNRATTATVPREEPGSHLRKLEEMVPPNKSLSPESDPGLPRRERTSGRYDMWTPILGTLVIGAAVLLGILMGWRLGWQRATLGLRGSAPYRANASSQSTRTDQTVLPS
jgi:hypothetical protein